jgi:hypothetical protein
MTQTPGQPACGGERADDQRSQHLDAEPNDRIDIEGELTQGREDGVPR